MPIPDQSIQEHLSLAYCHAVITYAGFTFDKTNQGNDFGIDGVVSHMTVYNGEYLPNGPVMLLQIKATHNFTEHGENIHFSLKMKAYRKLKSASTHPQVLVVYTMPEDKQLWFEHTHERLLLHKCAYWIRAADIPDGVQNEESYVIQIPKANLFNPEAVHQLAQPALTTLGVNNS